MSESNEKKTFDFKYNRLPCGGVVSVKVDRSELPDTFCSTKWGVAYRRGPTAWRLAAYPFRASREKAEKLKDWLNTVKANEGLEMKVVSINL